MSQEKAIIYHQIDDQVRGLRLRPDLNEADLKYMISAEYEADLPTEPTAPVEQPAAVQGSDRHDPNLYLQQLAASEQAAQQRRAELLDIYRPLSEDEQHQQLLYGINHVLDSRRRQRAEALAEIDVVVDPVELEVAVETAPRKKPVKSVKAAVAAKRPSRQPVPVKASQEVGDSKTSRVVDYLKSHPRRTALGAVAVVMAAGVWASGDTGAEPVAAVEGFVLPGGEAACAPAGQLAAEGSTKIGVRYDDHYGNPAWFPNTPILAEAASANLSVDGQVEVCLTEDAVELTESDKGLIVELDPAALDIELEQVDGQSAAEVFSFKKAIPEGQFLPLQKNSQGELIDQASQVTAAQAAEFTAATGSGFVGQAEAEQISGVLAEVEPQLDKDMSYFLATAAVAQCQSAVGESVVRAARQLIRGQADTQSVDDLKIKLVDGSTADVDQLLASYQLQEADKPAVVEFEGSDIRYENLQMNCKPSSGKEG